MARIQGMKGPKGSLEERLRKRRYAFLARVCEKFGATKLALGHTRDDQAETVLMRILRGSGLAGMSAILPKRTLGAVEIVRPLIDVSRAEILFFLKAKRAVFRTDASNADMRFTRNRIRRRLLPLIEKEFNPNIKEGLAQMADLVVSDYQCLESLARDFIGAHVKRTARGLVVSLDRLKKLDIALRRLVFRGMLKAAQGDLKRIGYRHWAEMEDLLWSRRAGSRVHLPRRVAVLKTKNRLNISCF